MRCTGALTVRKARHRERQTAPAGGVPESKGRLRAAAPPRSRLSARSLGICCSLEPPRVRSRLGSTSPLQALHEVSGPARRDRGFSRAAWSFGGFPSRSRASGASSGPCSGAARRRWTPERRPAGAVCDPSRPLRPRHREQAYGPVTASSRDRRRDTVAIHIRPCSNRSRRFANEFTSSRTER